MNRQHLFNALKAAGATIFSAAAGHMFSEILNNKKNKIDSEAQAIRDKQMEQLLNINKEIQ